MAGEWLKFEANTPEKPEVFSITVAMGWDDPDLTVGKLLKVWRWFDQQTIDGNAPRVTLSLLDRISGVSGFAQSMCDVGWLVCSDAGISLPNFDRHNGKTAKDRCLTAKRVAKHKNNAGGNGADVTSPLPREEKRREEKEEPLKPLGASAPMDGKGEGVDDGDGFALEPPGGEKQRQVKPEFPEDFESAWTAYPARHGGNSKKDAFKHWNARRREGVPSEALLAGVVRYAAHCKADGKLGTQYVLQGATFFGAAKRYAEAWPVGPAPAAQRQPVVDQKFRPNGSDHSSSRDAMERSMAQHGVVVGENEEINF